MTRSLLIVFLLFVAVGGGSIYVKFFGLNVDNKAFNDNFVQFILPEQDAFSDKKAEQEIVFINLQDILLPFDWERVCVIKASGTLGNATSTKIQDMVQEILRLYPETSELLNDVTLQRYGLDAKDSDSLVFILLDGSLKTLTVAYKYWHKQGVQGEWSFEGGYRKPYCYIPENANFIRTDT